MNGNEMSLGLDRRIKSGSVGCNGKVKRRRCVGSAVIWAIGTPPGIVGLESPNSGLVVRILDIEHFEQLRTTICIEHVDIDHICLGI